MEKFNYIFKALVGSQAYGTNTSTSDIDIKGVYLQHPDDILSFKYKEHIEASKDEFYYEVRKFIELLKAGNPTVLELLYSPNDCIIEKKPVFDLIIKNRDKFLTQRCFESFGKYAESQIKKARGLNKKMNWENSRVVRKNPLDFCYVYLNGRTMPLKKWLDSEGKFQEYCGLVALDHFRDCYALYYDYNSFGYHGIIKEDSNDIRLSSIPKGEMPIAIINYNKDGYTKHCNDYRSYKKWQEECNTQRYIDVKGHNQKIDGKNLLHCRRLLDVAIEIATDKTIRVRRPNADYLLKIRRGELSLEEIIDNAEKDLTGLQELYLNSGLPEECDAEFVNDLLVQIRNYECQ